MSQIGHDAAIRSFERYCCYSGFVLRILHRFAIFYNFNVRYRSCLGLMQKVVLPFVTMRYRRKEPTLRFWKFRLKKKVFVVIDRLWSEVEKITVNIDEVSPRN